MSNNASVTFFNAGSTIGKDVLVFKIDASYSNFILHGFWFLLLYLLVGGKVGGL